MPLTGFVCQNYITDQNGKYVGYLYCRTETKPPGWVFRTAGEGPPDDKDFTLVDTDDEAIAACDKFLKDSGYIGQAWACPDHGLTSAPHT
jgi:hypothetical protein